MVAPAIRIVLDHAPRNQALENSMGGGLLKPGKSTDFRQSDASSAARSNDPHDMQCPFDALRAGSLFLPRATHSVECYLPLFNLSSNPFHPTLYA